MNVCDLLTSAGYLQKATIELGRRWTETRSTWQDETAQAFEKQFLAPVPTQIRMLLSAASELHELLQKAERDCRDEASEVS